jgi:hypothetical protein
MIAANFEARNFTYEIMIVATGTFGWGGTQILFRRVRSMNPLYQFSLSCIICSCFSCVDSGGDEWYEQEGWWDDLQFCCHFQGIGCDSFLLNIQSIRLPTNFLELWSSAALLRCCFLLATLALTFSQIISGSLLSDGVLWVVV